MISWLSRHRPRRRKESAPKPEPAVSTTHSPAVFRRNPRRKDTDATLVDDDSSECSSPRSSRSFFDKRSASPTLFDSPPPSPLNDPKELPHSDDPTTWKKLEQQSRFFGPVTIGNEPQTPTPRSRLGKLASATAHSIGAVLQASVVIGEASNLPYLKGLAGIILLVSNTVQATEDNKEDCIRLSKMVLDIATIAARGLDAEQYNQGLQSVDRACDRIRQALDRSSKRSYARRFLESINERELLVQCEKELQHCLDVFQVRFHISAAAAVSRRETLDEKFLNDVEEVVRPVKDVLNEQSVWVDEPESIATEFAHDSADHIPPASQIFYGRDAELATLLDLFAPSSNNPFKAPSLSATNALLGQPGSGKTALALQLVHHPRIVERFAQRRAWVGCEGAACAEDIVKRLANHLGIDSPSRTAVLNSLGQGERPWLVVFDDLDDAWDTDSPELKLSVEGLITDISTLPQVSVVLTLCGTQRPLGPVYSKPPIPPLGSIDACSGRELFYEISGLDGEPQTDELLALVGCHPFATTFLAQQAQFEPVDFLLERFRETPIVDALDTRIRKTLTSSRIGECPAALEVLRLLVRTQLQTGPVKKAELGKVVVAAGLNLPTAMVNKCLSALHKTCLVVLVDESTVKVPEIVCNHLEWSAS
ncbi:hypothetical protein MIND_00684100 [Mycena indigotica]|uniref:Uncharacterized protein n=1 Tax=Mycena indigotica TaxID=2126181 RepID=A0A8H6SNR7_9AGAR|nr:uncharacterized protein MIND_00684100 [Mycena indigotica]KAF7301195.1 hypothetical protein MIND_00684100 [Mycena indigotica]